MGTRSDSTEITEITEITVSTNCLGGDLGGPPVTLVRWSLDFPSSYTPHGKSLGNFLVGRVGHVVRVGQVLFWPTRRFSARPFATARTVSVPSHATAAACKRIYLSCQRSDVYFCIVLGGQFQLSWLIFWRVSRGPEKA